MNDDGRNDPRELNLKNEQLTTLTIKTDNNEIPMHEVFKEFSGQFMEHISEPKINICSLHWMDIEIDNPPSTFNNRLFSMGDKLLLITNHIKFFEILDKAIEKIGLQFSRRKTEYYDPKTYNGELTLHQKDVKYQYQNEYRILIGPTNNEPIKLKLPGLKKISHNINLLDYPEIRIKVTEPNK
ncbi:MAG: hypothetical protein KI790_10620 [Cyclobacteriaceae bacterium]|nr:hypothetical protein [Cyclobacteriaceae bacterium HetDA_MAG_MS6]